jgi:lipopolysaccharide transport system ATP-binding protein
LPILFDFKFRSVNPVIKVENISKSYVIRHQRSEGYSTLRETIAAKTKSVFSSHRESPVERSELFWALKDVSFEVQEGDRIGIIGRNGAGKSTLLKILSRITEPTTGKISIKGRIASLLEVGTGFHPELTGRENIFLNGSILGMSRTEIKSKFDEIVAFAGTEKFLDTPVKRYSSGMYVRLAFAVAAHLESEVLIMDEVLAVGDAEFQKKCLGKMKDISTQGRTVLFVSHSMASIQNLCSAALYLSDGRISAIGETNKVIDEYLAISRTTSLINLRDRKERSGSGQIKFVAVKLLDENNNELSLFQSGKYSVISLQFERNTDSPIHTLHVSVPIEDGFGHRVLYLSNEMTNEIFNDVSIQNNTINIRLNKLPLKEGIYTFTIFGKVNGEIADWVQHAGTFEVESGDFFKTGKVVPGGQSSVLVEHHFEIK